VLKKHLFHYFFFIAEASIPVNGDIMRMASSGKLKGILRERVRKSLKAFFELDGYVVTQTQHFHKRIVFFHREAILTKSVFFKYRQPLLSAGLLFAVLTIWGL